MTSSWRYRHGIVLLSVCDGYIARRTYCGLLLAVVIYVRSWPVGILLAVCPMDLLPDTQNCALRMRWECRERFPRHRLQSKPLLSDPGVHHGKCGTHVPHCMSGSLTRGGRENVLGIPGACATLNVTYLVRGPWCKPTVMSWYVYCACTVSLNRLLWYVNRYVPGLDFAPHLYVEFPQYVLTPKYHSHIHQSLYDGWLCIFGCKGSISS